MRVGHRAERIGRVGSDKVALPVTNAKLQASVASLVSRTASDEIQTEGGWRDLTELDSWGSSQKPVFPARALQYLHIVL